MIVNGLTFSMSLPLDPPPLEASLFSDDAAKVLAFLNFVGSGKYISDSPLEKDFIILILSYLLVPVKGYLKLYLEKIKKF